MGTQQERTMRRQGTVTAVLRGLLLLVVCAGAMSGCTTVKFVQKNPWTGEIWTVYSNSFGSDTVTYCPPTDGSPCREAMYLGSAPPPQTPAPAPTPQ